MVNFLSKLFENFTEKLKIKAIVAEFLAMTIFIYIGCGTVMTFLAPPKFQYDDQPLREPSYLSHTNTTFGVVVPFVFGITVMVLAYTASILDAGQLNPAVTLGLLLTQKIAFMHAVGMGVVQFVGSMLAVGLLHITVPNAKDSGFGSNSLSAGVSVGNAVIGEAFLTFVLMSVVLLIGKDENKGITAPIAIGFTVFIAHGVLLPIDGCSINPARSFGPALASKNWDNFWVFVVGPIIGTFFAVGLYYLNEFLIQIQQQQINQSQNTEQTQNSESGHSQQKVQNVQDQISEQKSAIQLVEQLAKESQDQSTSQNISLTVTDKNQQKTEQQKQSKQGEQERQQQQQQQEENRPQPKSTFSTGQEKRDFYGVQVSTPSEIITRDD
eukprot:TRINITY_DN8698_c0_g1_i1.p1 TRINITY_DN8698_c0_g1~~TRINITY_DN8698_c0_g1_i1.p1  ORF type:complete len:412 (-),score=43.56 TRINITY_DN8698_c0_g1_i1:190-1335(-)